MAARILRRVGLTSCIIILVFLAIGGGAALFGVRHFLNQARPENLILSPGKYELGGYRVDVWKSHGLVQYRMSDSSGREVLKSREDGMDHSRWYLYLDPATDWLWHYSGDVGFFAWKKLPDGTFQREAIENANLAQQMDLICQMPLPVFSRLPGSIQRKVWHALTHR